MSNSSTPRSPALQSVEKLLLGSNSIDGTVRIFGFILLFIIVAGTIFHFTGA